MFFSCQEPIKIIFKSKGGNNRSLIEQSVHLLYLFCHQWLIRVFKNYLAELLDFISNGNTRTFSLITGLANTFLGFIEMVPEMVSR